ncbi:MAG: hypothetical protein NTU41_08790 [Chloroflexi bacterium]|nr:hypothetical protein [Chloroflexota bacterium]
MSNATGEAMSLVLVVHQDVYQWIARQRDGWGAEYRKRSAVLRVSRPDLKRLGVMDGAHVKLENDSGLVVVEVKADPTCPEGIGFMVTSLYSNRLASYDPSRSSLPTITGIRATATATAEGITPLSDLLPRKTVA